MSNVSLATRTIGLKEAILLIAGIVEDFGADHMAAGGDGGCSYTVERQEADVLTPLCIVGVLFSRLGILRAVFTPNGQEGACTSGMVMWANAAHMGVTFTDEAQQFLYLVQQEQDRPSGWGSALRTAVASTREAVIQKAREESDIFGYYIDRRVTDATGEAPEQF